MHALIPHSAESSSRVASHKPPLLRRAQNIAAILIAAAALSGCQSMTMNSAQVRVIDASSNSGPIDSYQDSTALAYNLDYGTATSYVPSAPGTSTLSLDKAGTRQTLVAAKNILTAGKQYTEIVAGSLANMQQTTLVDQSTPAPSGQFAIRVVNEASNAGPIDVYMVPPRARLSNTSPIATNLAVGMNTGYITIPDGTFSLSVLPSGVAPSAAARLFSGPQVDYPSGTVRTTVLIDRQSTNPDNPSPSQAIQAITATDADAQ